MIIEGYFFLLKLYVVTPHLNHLIEMVQMRGHNMFLCLIINKYSLVSRAVISGLK